MLFLPLRLQLVKRIRMIIHLVALLWEIGKAMMVVLVLKSLLLTIRVFMASKKASLLLDLEMMAPGAGRLEFDGKKSIIESNAFASGLGGLSLDFDKGEIKMYEPDKKHDNKKSIILNAAATSYPFTIGDKFKVKWAGSINAKNG